MNQTRILIVVGVLAVLGFGLWWCSPPPPRVSPRAEQAVEDLPPNMRIAVAPTVDDRFVKEPCCLVPSGGLAGLPYLLREAVDGAPRKTEDGAPLAVPVFMGSMSHVPGELGATQTLVLYREVVTQTHIRVVAVGPAELAHGSAFVREGLTTLAPRDRCAFLCANVRDGQGGALLDVYAVTTSEGHVCLFTAVLAESAASELAARGSDVQVTDAEAALRKALDDGTTRVEGLGQAVTTAVALVHGTVAEARRLAERVPGYRLVVASGSSALPLLEPMRVGGAPETTVTSAGRGMRHGLFVEVPGSKEEPIHVESIRIGVALEAGVGGTRLDPTIDLLMQRELPRLFRIGVESGRPVPPGGSYVGAKRCAECHKEIVTRHDQSPHARMPLSLRSSPWGANSSCLVCHTTGPFARGGYTGPEDFTDLAGVSCEACHGPGSEHVAAPERGWGMQVAKDSCMDCHLPERSPGFHPVRAWSEFEHGGR